MWGQNAIRPTLIEKRLERVQFLPKALSTALADGIGFGRLDIALPHTWYETVAHLLRVLCIAREFFLQGLVLQCRAHDKEHG